MRKIKAILTFDDGVLSHYTLLKPLLKKFGFSATVFVTIPHLWMLDYIVALDPESKEVNLNYDQIVELHKAGIEIGNHTYSHIDTTKSSSELIVEEVEKLEKIFSSLGLPRSTSFCYPTFRSDLRSAQVLKSLGFKFARSGYTSTPMKEWHGYPDLRGTPPYFIPGQTNPLEAFCTGVLNGSYTVKHLRQDVENCPENGFPVFAAHGIVKKQTYNFFVEACEYMANAGHAFVACRDICH